MPSFKATARNTISKWASLWKALTNGGSGGQIEGHSDGAGFGHTLTRDLRLDIPERPQRSILGSLEYSRDLLELIEWSPEARTALSFLSRDPFMEREGRIGSWQVGETVEGDTKVNPNIIAVANELKTRRYGKQLILGGLRLQEAARRALGTGDAFLQLAIEKEGITPGRYCISRSLYMPTFSMFVKEDDVGDEHGYFQRLENGDEVHFDPLKILHFSYERRRLYGESIFFQSIPGWRKFKRTSPATEKIVTQNGVAPWLHIMSETATERDREAYERQHKADRANGFLGDLYLPHGATVRKADGNVSGIAETINYEQQLIKRMIPLGLPAYFFSSLSNTEPNAREISGQPAMLYARTIASIRSMLGEQIRWALDIELCLAFGFDFVRQNPYDIVWPEWDVLPPSQMSPRAEPKPRPDDKSKVDSESQEDRRLRAV